MHNQLRALSPLYGRYGNSVKDLAAYFSEAALMRYRLYIEIEYLIALSHEKQINDFPGFSKDRQARLRKIYQDFNAAGAKEIKTIEFDHKDVVRHPLVSKIIQAYQKDINDKN